MFLAKIHRGDRVTFVLNGGDNYNIKKESPSLLKNRKDIKIAIAFHYCSWLSD
jgi:hypothetical protein